MVKPDIVVCCVGAKEKKKFHVDHVKDLGVLAFWGKLEAPRETSGKLTLEGGNCLDHSQQPSIVLKNRHIKFTCAHQKKKKTEMM